MSVKGGYIGNVKLRVFFMSRGPFYGQPKQEASFFMSNETQKYITNDEIEGLPEPIGGVRLAEAMQNYDNFLMANGKYLEEAEYTYTDPIAYYDESTGETTTGGSSGGGSSGGTGSTGTTGSTGGSTGSSSSSGSTTSREESAQPAAKQRAELITGTTSTSSTTTAVSPQKTFFTWQVTQNIFGNVVGADFSDPQKILFTYGLPIRPDDVSKTSYLCPFFARNVTDQTDGANVHWGAITSCAIPANQPIELTYYYEGRTHNSPFQPYDEDAIFEGLNTEVLGTSAYFAVNFGVGSRKGHYLLLFVKDNNPVLYRINGPKTTFVATFDDANLRQKLFDQNSPYFTLKIEPVVGSFIITSNLFSRPWIVLGGEFAQTSEESKLSPVKGPYFSGNGQLRVFGGNVQAGWSFRPVQYVYEGIFDTPPNTFSTTQGSYIPIRASLVLKGTGSTVTGIGTGGIQMYDAEHVSGAEGGGKKFTVGYEQPHMNRKISVRIIKKLLSGGSGGVGLTKGLVEAYAKMTLLPSAVNTSCSFTIYEGRSPYIWMDRLEAPTKKGTPGEPTLDVTGDVLSVQLSYNANTYNEIVQTGTLRILNPLVINAVRGSRKCKNGINDYQQFMNRAIYVKIGCHFENGQGLKGADDWLFEGMTVGSEITFEAGRQIIVFKLADYMNVLEHCKFELCPYYDGMVAKYVVRDILEATGLATSRIKTGKLPITSTPNMASDYVLPYVDLRTEPQFKFPDGSSYKEAVLKIAKLDFKTAFFDRFGDFHYDQAPDILGSGSPAPKVRFYSNPRNAPAAHQIAFNSATLGRAVNDVYNIIRIDSIDRILQIRVTANARYEAGISNPAAVGYLGFRKMLLVREPALGAMKAVYRYAQSFQKKMHIPPKTIRFECFGRFDLQPMDIVALDNQRVRIMNISYEILAAENKFWMTIDGEWFDDFSASNPTIGDPYNPPSTPKPKPIAF